METDWLEYETKIVEIETEAIVMETQNGRKRWSETEGR